VYKNTYLQQYPCRRRFKFTNGNFAPNSEVTKLLKYRFPTSPARVTAAAYYKAVRDVQQGKTVVSNHDKPLQWSDTMRDSIKYEVADES